MTYQSYCCFWQRYLPRFHTSTVWTSAETQTQCCLIIMFLTPLQDTVHEVQTHQFNESRRLWSCWWVFVSCAAYLPRQNLPPLLLLLWAVVRLSPGQPPVLVELQSNMITSTLSSSQTAHFKEPSDGHCFEKEALTETVYQTKAEQINVTAEQFKFKKVPLKLEVFLYPNLPTADNSQHTDNLRPWWSCALM